MSDVDDILDRVTGDAPLLQPEANRPCPWPIGACPHPNACPCADEQERRGHTRENHLAFLDVAYAAKRPSDG